MENFIKLLMQELLEESYKITQEDDAEEFFRNYLKRAWLNGYNSAKQD
jgi:hypothetical protein